MKQIILLGATGSIGRTTLDLVREQPEQFRITAMTAHRNVEKLATLAQAFKPDLAVIADPACYAALKDALAGTGIRVAAGAEGMQQAAQDTPCDIVIGGIVGAAGLQPTCQAIAPGRIIAFANKECLVCAGDLFMQRIGETGATLIPVDSEHHALFQLLHGHAPERVKSLILTASGGPFRTWSPAQLAAATPEQAVRHPVWAMGAKISVDSATMMNKGLEVIEAHYLFNVPEDRIKVWVHPESVIHGLVRLQDGGLLAHMDHPTMRSPLATALHWPDMPRLDTGFDVEDMVALTLHPPDPARFPLLPLARQCLRNGQESLLILNMANEAAVAAFLNRTIPFTAIESSIKAALDHLTGQFSASLQNADIMSVLRVIEEIEREVTQSRL